MRVRYDESFKKLQSGASFAAYLDNPREGESEGKLRVQGWVLPKRGDLSQVNVVISLANGERITTRLEIPRNTVIEKILRAEPEGHEKLNCGFRKYIDPFAGPLKVSVYSDQELWCEWLIEVEAPPQDGCTVVTQWEAFRLGVSAPPATEDSAKTAPALGYRVVKADDFETLADESLLPFFDVVTAPDFGFSACRSLARLGKLYVKSPYSVGAIQPAHSFWSGRSHVVRLADDLGNSIYLLQLWTSCDAFYLPKTNTFVVIRYVRSVEIEAFASFVVQNIDRLHTAFNEPSAFAGLLATASRPSHFFSNVAPTVRYAIEHGGVPNLFYLRGGDFAPLAPVLGIDAMEQTLTDHEFNAATLWNGTFAFHAGVPFFWGQEASARLFDQRYAEYASAAASEVAKRMIAEMRNGFPILWVGITGQKREWIEQIEGCALVLERLNARFQSLAVVFDGWTSPRSPSRIDEVETANDSAVTDGILRMLAEKGIKLKTWSVVGFTAVDKTAVAQEIDFFLANHGTGSIQVARFARKPGVSHLSTRFMGTHGKEAIHYRTRTIPARHIADLPGDRPDRVSYSISPEAVWDEFQALLDSLPVGALRG